MPSPTTPVEWREYWDARWAREPSRYGDDANPFVVEELSSLTPRRVLDAACGRGRNAVWLADRGHTVTAVDISPVAIDQARALAQPRGAAVEFVAADLLEWEPEAGGYDVILLSYLQVPAEVRRRVHRRLASALRPGGIVLLVAHHADNLEHGHGGPDYPEVLYSEADLRSDFDDLNLVRNERVTRSVALENGEATALDIVLVATTPA